MWFLSINKSLIIFLAPHVEGQLVKSDSTDIVAIKVLKDSVCRKAEEDFMREVDIMSTFRHKNILSLIGVVPRDSCNGPWMVFEYMPFGDLAEVLRKNSPTVKSTTSGLPPLTKVMIFFHP